MAARIAAIGEIRGARERCERRHVEDEGEEGVDRDEPRSRAWSTPQATPATQAAIATRRDRGGAGVDDRARFPRRPPLQQRPEEAADRRRRRSRRARSASPARSPGGGDGSPSRSGRSGAGRAAAAGRRSGRSRIQMIASSTSPRFDLFDRSLSTSSVHAVDAGDVLDVVPLVVDRAAEAGFAVAVDDRLRDCRGCRFRSRRRGAT